MRCQYREQKYICGNYLDVAIFPVRKKATQRSRRSKPSTEIQDKLNNINSVRKLRRLLETNFTSNDYEIHLTYRDEELPEDEQTAKKDVQNFLRRIKRAYTAAGIELKYVWVTEKGARSERIHHHITISGGISRDDIEAAWHKGYANTKRLQFAADGLAGLAHYITKQPLFFKRWNASRNLKQPIVKENDYRISGRRAAEIARGEASAELLARLYPDYYINTVEACNCDAYGHYIQIRLYKKTALIQ